jgi:hypothetical protein
VGLACVAVAGAAVTYGSTVSEGELPQ